MQLYRIMLVDDEEEARESIIRKIDWEAVGFELVGDAENGLDALEKLDILKPDILFTDIRMPYMDGLELAKQVRIMYPSIKVVIFSGFDEFEYAKEAIRLNVIEYILKPVNVEELTQILRKIKLMLDEELRRRRDINALRDSYRKHLPVLRERFLNDLAHGRVENWRIPALVREFGLDLADAESFAVAHFVVDKADNSGFLPPGEPELIPLSVRRMAEEMLASHTHSSSFLTSRGVCFVIALDQAMQLDSLIALLRDICRECKRAMGLMVTVGLGQPAENLEDLPASYRESVEALLCKPLYDVEGVIYICDVQRQNNAQGIVDEAKLFIQEHFCDKSLSLEAVCQKLHISAAYFSTVFKRETGQSYINYLTGLRMEKAVGLLKHTDDKTYLIAEKVGYSDPNYFSYAFKKKFGVSPTKYRAAL